MMELEYRVSELERRMNNMIRICTVDVTQGDRAVVRDGSGLKTGFLPWLTLRAGKDRSWWAPEPGEQVVLLCPYGEPCLGVILPSIYRDMFPAPADVRTVHRTVYDDGAVIEYDRAAHRLKADIPGTIEATAQNVIVTAAVRVNGPLHVTQGITSDTSLDAVDITGSGSVSAPSVKAGGVEVTEHDHECPHGGRTSILGE